MSARTRKSGELEALMMAALWDSSKPCSGIELQTALVDRFNQPELALTTVLTVLGRLSEKGLVNRVPGTGRSILFEAAQSREEHSARALLNILSAEADSELTLTHFVGAMTAAQREALNKALKPNP